MPGILLLSLSLALGSPQVSSQEAPPLRYPELRFQEADTPGVTALYRVSTFRESPYGYTTRLTTDRALYLSLVAQGGRDEGIVGGVFATEVPGSTPLFELTYITHIFYTTDAAAHAAGQSGATNDRIVCYVLKAADAVSPSNAIVEMRASSGGLSQMAFNNHDLLRWRAHGYDVETAAGFVIRPSASPASPPRPFSKAISPDWLHVSPLPLTWPDGVNPIAGSPQDPLDPMHRATREVLARQGVTGAEIAILWSRWELNRVGTAPVLEKDRVGATCLPTEEPFEGYCYLIQKDLDAEMRFWASKDAEVTATLKWTPEYAKNPKCDHDATVNGYNREGAPNPEFCAPRNDADTLTQFKRFVRMIAYRYGGLRTYGRLTDVIVFNEVNVAPYFNAGCNPTRCDDAQKAEWRATYAAYYSAAYDEFESEGTGTRTFINAVGMKNGDSLFTPAEVFLVDFDARVSPPSRPRTWNLAIHPNFPYERSVFFDPFELEFTGALSWANFAYVRTWLLQTFNRDVLVAVDEGGVNSGKWEFPYTPKPGDTRTRFWSTPEMQAQLLCRVYRAYLGTPGMAHFTYYRLLDEPFEIRTDLRFGLFTPGLTADGLLDLDSGGRIKSLVAKPSWLVWSSMNQKGSLSCGYGDLAADPTVDPATYTGPYFTRLSRYGNSKTDPNGLFRHWNSTRPPPSDPEFRNPLFPNVVFVEEAAWALFRDRPTGGASSYQMLYECTVGRHTLVLPNLDCAGRGVNGGPLGYVYTPASSAVPSDAVLIRSCGGAWGKSGDHFVSDDPLCEGYPENIVLGYAPRKLFTGAPATPLAITSIYRVYNDVLKKHHYTNDLYEYEVLGTRGWSREGVAYKLLTESTYKGSALKALFRLYNPALDKHLWTTDAFEATVLQTRGYNLEGNTGYVLPDGNADGSVPLYRLSRPPTFHLWTTDAFEYSVLQQRERGWTGEGSLGNVFR
jgi:hypothetical protein